MRIGTWNVEYAYARRLAALREVITANSADIWVLTETHDDLAPPDCQFAAHSEQRPKNWSGIRPGSRWVSIWSRYPIIAEVSLSRADRERTVAVLLDLGEGRTTLVYGTVMPWKGDGEKFDWSEHHRVIPEQCAEWLELKQTYSKAKICVAGDFNTDMGSGSYYGTKHGIAALHAGLVACDAFCATDPARFPTGLLPYPLIDHIALPIEDLDSTSVIAAWPADKKALSDHSGVIVEVKD
jgi:exonuclease III